jgi:hypothetical protein
MSTITIELNEEVPAVQYLKMVAADEGISILEAVVSTIDLIAKEDQPFLYDEDEETFGEKCAVEICCEYVIDTLAGMSGGSYHGDSLHDAAAFALQGNIEDDVRQIVELALHRLNTLTEDQIRDFVAEHKREMFENGRKHGLRLVETSDGEEGQ